MYWFQLGNIGSALGRQYEFTWELKYWFNMNSEMYWFQLEDIRSDVGRQNEFAEWELKYWLNMER